MPEKQKVPWSSLTNEKDRLDRLAKVLTRAGTDATFRNACLDKQTGQSTIENEAGVTFDRDVVVRCFPDKQAAEKEILLLLPDLPPPKAGGQHRAEEGWWMCTYFDYNPRVTLLKQLKELIEQGEKLRAK